ncbi:YicC/YloC family endoribonuclease [Spirochaetota bacterium]
MESMTGYAFLEKSNNQFSFSVEIKSLNSRYFETYINLPRILRNDENDLSKILKDRFNRGKIELNIDIFDWTETRPVSLNSDIIEKYYGELEKIQKRLKIKEPLKFESVLMLEGLIHRERSELSDNSKRDIYNTLNLVIGKAIAMRNKEGTVTKKDILSSITYISKGVRRIKSLSKNVKTEKINLLKKRIKDLGSEIDDLRVFSEIAILSDKLDINEELVRLSDHLTKFKEVVTGKGQVGKKLDFLSQEMFREINTISSKSNSSEISHIVVEMKNHIDKIREQCRNIV